MIPDPTELHLRDLWPYFQDLPFFSLFPFPAFWKTSPLLQAIQSNFPIFLSFNQNRPIIFFGQLLTQKSHFWALQFLSSTFQLCQFYPLIHVFRTPIPLLLSRINLPPFVDLQTIFGLFVYSRYTFTPTCSINLQAEQFMHANEFLNLKSNSRTSLSQASFFAFFAFEGLVKILGVHFLLWAD